MVARSPLGGGAPRKQRWGAPHHTPAAALRMLVWAVPAGDGPRRDEAGGAAKEHVPVKKQISACVLLWALVS